MKALVVAILVGAVLCAQPCAAAGQAAPRPAESQATQPARTIPYRKDDDIGALALNVGLGLLVALGVGVGVLYALRRYLAGVQKAPGRRLRVLETVRLGPKSALVLVEVDGSTLLIGQQGESLAVLDRPAGPAGPAPAPAPADHAA